MGAIGFYSLAVAAALQFTHSEPGDSAFHPPITILKPLCGRDEHAAENLATFCQQDYPHYQIIFAVQDQGDAAIGVVEHLIREFPDRDLHLVVNAQTLGANPKVSNLANALAEAKYDILVIADSDIRVGSDYLKRIVQPLRDSAVGVVTCPYRSIAQGWVTRLEALGTATELHAGVLVAQKLEGMSFALGATIGIRRSVLEKIGGFAAIADDLADDYQLGHLPALAGYKVVLSDYVVDHVLASSPFRTSLRRQIRWARGIRVSRFWGYLGMIFTYGTVTSLLLPVTGGSIAGWTILVATWTARSIAAWTIGGWWLKDPSVQRFWWLIPLRDLFSFGIWLCGFVGDSIEWRGQQFRLIKGGKLIKAELQEKNSAVKS